MRKLGRQLALLALVAFVIAYAVTTALIAEGRPMEHYAIWPQASAWAIAFVFIGALLWILGVARGER